MRLEYVNLGMVFGQNFEHRRSNVLDRCKLERIVHRVIDSIGKHAYSACKCTCLNEDIRYVHIIKLMCC